MKFFIIKFVFLFSLIKITNLLIPNEILYIDGDFWFPFPTISTNYSSNASLDLSYLNWKIEDRIKVKDGHFYYKNSEVKFFGTNVAYSSCFPSKNSAPLIAKRMAQLGINVLRFHHMDNRDIWEKNNNTKLSEEKLDLLHYFLFCLKNNGIYANINLHVSRVYPEISKEEKILEIFKYGKSLDRYYPQFIQDQMNYARDLLTSYNNYTGYKIGDDPMILNIELNNENTMFNLESETNYEILNDNLKNELNKQWKSFIKDKYKNFDEINNFYNNETLDMNNNLVENNTITCQKNNGKYNINGKTVEFDIYDIPTTSYGNQIHYGTIDIENYTLYTIDFYVKAENLTEDTFSFSFQENKSPYRIYGRISNIKFSTELQHYVISLKSYIDCQLSSDSKAKPKFILPTSKNHYEFSNFKLYKGRPDFNFTENGEKNLDKILYPNAIMIQNLPNMAYDLRMFFYNTEINTQKKITNYIKNELGFKDLLILDSQINYGSFLSYIRENEFSDIMDIHAYWEHPNFETGHSWDRNYYSIKNTPMIKSKSFGTLNRLSKGKSKNKPYTISEYNHPFPNEHLHEKFAFFGSWAAFHDFDAIYQFSYDTSDNKYISGYFSMATNPIDFAMVPYTVLAFRNNFVVKSENFVKLKLSKGYVYEKMKDKNYNLDQFLENYFYTGWNAFFEVEILDDLKIIEPEMNTNIDTSSKNNLISPQIKWNISELNNETFYYVNTDKIITLTGFLGNVNMDKKNNLGDLLDIKIKLNESLNETCTIGILSLDNKNLENSEKILLTIVGKVRNTDQMWNEARTSTSKSWGKAPSLVQYIEFEACLKFQEDQKPDIYSINNLGELNEKFDIKGEGGNWILNSDENNPALNYYIIRHLPPIQNDDDNESSYVVVWIIVPIILIGIGIGVFLIIRKRRIDKNWGINTGLL